MWHPVPTSRRESRTRDTKSVNLLKLAHLHWSEDGGHSIDHYIKRVPLNIALATDRDL